MAYRVKSLLEVNKYRCKFFNSFSNHFYRILKLPWYVFCKSIYHKNPFGGRHYTYMVKLSLDDCSRYLLEFFKLCQVV
uniref:Uncharacterized protein n=1 Tax=Lepeophtheirus salmonis TaxID=72036 RepID=A0A0K2UKW6_LEPSM